MRSGRNAQGHSYHCHLPFPNLWRHCFGVLVIDVSIIIPGNPLREGETRCMWQLELCSVPHRDISFIQHCFCGFLQPCIKVKNAAVTQAIFFINICASCNRKARSTFSPASALCGCAHNFLVRRNRGKWGQVFAQFVILLPFQPR